MSASLVGSEMCIRDRPPSPWMATVPRRPHPWWPVGFGNLRIWKARRPARGFGAILRAESYGDDDVM
eukprot:281417-Alexandrium_andersonii.AAC.1